MFNNFHFIGRENELSILYAIINKNGPAIGVVYGRKRVGKTDHEKCEEL